MIDQTPNVSSGLKSKIQKEIGITSSEEGGTESQDTVEDYKGIVLGGSEAAKHSLEKLGKISDGSSCSGVENSCNHSQRIGGQIISDSDEEVDIDE